MATKNKSNNNTNSNNNYSSHITAADGIRHEATMLSGTRG